MKVFVVGDYYSGTGPANVTKEYIRTLPKGTLYQKSKNKVARLAELYTTIPRSDVVLLSGHSKQNLHAIRIAKKHNKKVAFLMHGCVEYENSINGVPDESMNLVERKTLEGSDLILAVSNQFEHWLKKQYPQYADKISHVTNGVDYKIINERPVMEKRSSNKIISIGGGMPRKRIVIVCRAIQNLIDKGMDITLTVAGDNGLDSDKIDEFEFVENIGLVNHDRMIKELQGSKLFIQNSCFETFGLAPVEAIMCGCDILLSKECGALSLFKTGVYDDDIIYDTENVEEIAEKIEKLLNNENHNRLIVELDKEHTSWEYRSAQLQSMLKNLTEKE